MSAIVAEVLSWSHHFNVTFLITKLLRLNCIGCCTEIRNSHQANPIVVTKLLGQDKPSLSAQSHDEEKSNKFSWNGLEKS